MKKGKSRVNFSEETGISSDALNAYLAGALPDDQVALFEKLLEQDEFAREAVEGWRSANNNLAETKLQEVENVVRKRTGLHEAKIVSINYGRWLLAAASVVLFVGLGFLMVQWWGAQQKQMALGDAAESEESVLGGEAAAVLTDTVVALTDSLPVLSDSTVNVNTEPATALATEGQSGTVTELKDPAPKANEDKRVVAELKKEEKQSGSGGTTMVAAAPAVLEQKEIAAADAAPREKNVTSKAPAAAAGFEARDMKTLQVVETLSSDDEAKDQPTESLMTNARENFNKGEYAKASKTFNKVLNKEPDNVDALYFGGISDYVSGNYKRAEKNFDKLLKQGRKYTDGSKWYKANILLKSGKKEAATDLYRELTNTTGSFKDRAIKKMEELGYN